MLSDSKTSGCRCHWHCWYGKWHTGYFAEWC